MKTRFLFLSFLISLFFISEIKAQSDDFDVDTSKSSSSSSDLGGLADFYKIDTTKKYYANSIKWTYFYQVDSERKKYYAQDTSLHGFQNYSPLYSNNKFYKNLGNTGLAAQEMYPDFTTNLGFSSSYNVFSAYEFHPDSIRFYKTYTPFTEVKWISGLGKENIVDMIHTQNIKPNLNVGIRYMNQVSTGHYHRQQPRDNFFSAWLWHQSLDSRYNIATSFITNNRKTPENGGVVNDSLFTSNIKKSDHQYEDVYLNNALNTSHSNILSVKQSYILGTKDTLTNSRDSLFGNFYSKIANSITLSKRYAQFDYEYAPTDIYGNGDPLSAGDYFSNIYIDSTFASDRIVERKFRTDIDMTVFGGGAGADVYLGGGFAYENVNYEQSSVNSDGNRFTTFSKNINNLYLKGKAGFNISENIFTDVNAMVGVSGYNSGDFTIDATADIPISEELGYIKANAVIQSVEAGLIYEDYSSNFHQWHNDFKKVNTNKVGLSYVNTTTKSSIGVEYNIINNYAYFHEVNGDILPTQYSDMINIFRVKASQRFDFGRFTWASSYTFQSSNAEEVLAAPKFFTYQSFYVSYNIMSIKCQTGIDARYYSRFTPTGYAPELSQFYVSEDPEDAGNYTVYDVFFNAELKRCRFIIKYNYLNQGFSQDGYYTVDGYPMSDSSVSLGVVWRFYD